MEEEERGHRQRRSGQQRNASGDEGAATTAAPQGCTSAAGLERAGRGAGAALRASAHRRGGLRQQTAHGRGARGRLRSARAAGRLRTGCLGAGSRPPREGLPRRGRPAASGGAALLGPHRRQVGVRHRLLGSEPLLMVIPAGESRGTWVCGLCRTEGAGRRPREERSGGRRRCRRACLRECQHTRQCSAARERTAAARRRSPSRLPTPA